MLELKNICKDYLIDKTPFHALTNISIFFPKSEFCAILGPSGCGKTTTLNIIGGLDRYTSGDLVIEGKSTKTFTDKDWDNYRNKRIGFVFQSYNLVPHLTVLDNVELSLTIAGLKKKERLEKAKQALDKVGLDGIYNKLPNQLSGGQMQRVAIARSLVNDPEIILADEPTGALDSVTSVQVLDILKEISKTKLVIMVTHNEDLANKYADRIITFKDGEIENDSLEGETDKKFLENEKYSEDFKFNSLRIINENDRQNIKSLRKEKKENRTSMSFWTSFKISLKNLRSKKGRTIITSVAASFGIIGVALVLALSNGFSEYIGKIEEETAATLPVTLSSYTVTYDSIDWKDYNQSNKYPKDDEVYPYINTNNLANAHYSYNNFNDKYFNFLDYLRDEKHILNDYLVNYNNSYKYHLTTQFPASINGDEASYYKEVATSTSTGYVNSLLGSYTGLPTQVFHQLYGREEYILGSYDVIAGKYPTEKNQLVLVVDGYNSVSFSNLRALGFYNKTDTQNDVSDATSSKKVAPIKWSDIIGKKYKIFTANDEYTKYDGTAINDPAATFTDSSTKNPSYFTYDSDETSFKSDKGLDLEIVGILRPSKNSTLDTMAQGLCFLPSLQSYMVENNSVSELHNNFLNNVILKDGKTRNAFYGAIANILNNGSTSNAIVTEFNKIFNEYFDFYNPFWENNQITLSGYLNTALYEGIELVPSSLKAIGIEEPSKIAKFLTDALVGTSKNFYESMVGLAAYVNAYSSISSVVVFPKDLTSKQRLLDSLDDYNVLVANDPYHASSNDEQIFYTDLVTTFTKSLSQMISVISIVLVIFASISLVVSCVMTGIITYNSVLERTKEIGVLRAIGARKKDVGRLFQAESCIIGFISGLIGCLASYLISIPVNLILNAVYAEYNLNNICSMNYLHVIVLVIISILLTFISGLVPARIAAKKDPVVALRSV